MRFGHVVAGFGFLPPLFQRDGQGKVNLRRAGLQLQGHPVVVERLSVPALPLQHVGELVVPSAMSGCSRMAASRFQPRRLPKVAYRLVEPGQLLERGRQVGVDIGGRWL